MLVSSVEAAALQNHHEHLTRTFSSAAELGEWREYLDSVYGVSTMRFPFSLAELDFFYPERLPPVVAAKLVVHAPNQWNASGVQLLRGDLFLMGYYTQYIRRCTLSVCTRGVGWSERAFQVCAHDGFEGPRCPPCRGSCRGATLQPVPRGGEANGSFVEGIHTPIDASGTGLWFYRARPAHATRRALHLGITWRREREPAPAQRTLAATS